MSIATATGQALGLAPGTAMGYVSALKMLEEFAVSRGKSLVSAGALLLAEFAAETDASFALVKRASAAWRWMRVSAGMEPPSFVVMHQAVRHAATRAKRAGRISSKPATNVKLVMSALRDVGRAAKTVLDDTGSPVSRKFVAAREMCALVSACYGFCRASDLAAAWSESVAVTDLAVSFKCALSKEVLLSRGTGAMSDVLILGAVPEEPLVCPVTWFKLFLKQRSKSEATRVSKWLLCGAKGEKLEPATLSRPLKAVLSHAKVAGVPHSFRGSFASAALDIGFETGAVVRQGRWKSLSTFWRYYDRRGLVGVQLDAMEAARQKTSIVEFPRLLWRVVSR